MAYQQNIVNVVNRTTKSLDVMDDGRPYVIPPGYAVVPDIDSDTGAQRVRVDKDAAGKKTEVLLTKVVGADKHGLPSHNGKPFEFPMIVGAAIRARRQHILRGSQDPAAPQYAETLCAIVEADDPTDHQEQRDATVESFDRSMLPKHLQQVQTIANPHHIPSNKRRSLVDVKLTNLTGLRMDY
jgi:hypothetical protein